MIPLHYRILYSHFRPGYCFWIVRSKAFVKMLPEPLRNLIRNRKSVRYKIDMLIRPDGMKRYCPCCGLRFQDFEAGHYLKHPERYNPLRYENIRQDVLCPNCGALPRHRILASWCEKNKKLLQRSKILYFAPEHSMSLWLRKNGILFVTADMYHAADMTLDIQATDLPDASYDMIFCNHVLELVDDFRIALKEVYRILTPDGSFICSFPMDPKVELLDEDASVDSDEERYKRYGQVDHKRVFGIHADRFLTDAGFTVKAINGKDYPEEIMPVVGPADYDMNIMFWCSKTQA